MSLRKAIDEKYSFEQIIAFIEDLIQNGLEVRNQSDPYPYSLWYSIKYYDLTVFS